MELRFSVPRRLVFILSMLNQSSRGAGHRMPVTEREVDETNSSAENKLGCTWSNGNNWQPVSHGPIILLFLSINF